MSIFLVRSGAISIRKRKGSEFVEMARIHPKEIIGELSFFDRQPRSASAVAMTSVELVEIPFEALDKIYESVPPYMKAIIATLADRLRKANDTIRKLQEKTIKADHEADDEVDKESLASLEAELRSAKEEERKEELKTVTKKK